MEGKVRLRMSLFSSRLDARTRHRRNAPTDGRTLHL